MNSIMITLHFRIETKVRKLMRSPYKGIMLIYRSKQKVLFEIFSKQKVNSRFIFGTKEHQVVFHQNFGCVKR